MDCLAAAGEEETKEMRRIRLTRVDELQRMRDARPKRPSPAKLTSLGGVSPSAPNSPPHRVSIRASHRCCARRNYNGTGEPPILLAAPLINSPSHTFLSNSDEEAAIAMLAQDMLDNFRATGVDPFDAVKSQVDDLSGEDEYDPRSTLAYCPRTRIDRRYANALCMVAAAIGCLEQEAKEEAIAARRKANALRYMVWPHARLMMQKVASQIVQVGATKRGMERAEVGPAPVGFAYVQVGDGVYLLREDGDGPAVYIGEAHTVVIRTRH
ncbi:hypothetical protein C8R44DRAFT_896322 [Mycena epipterygia]|nr:hypothetical protein C8R44DRAFT_896322 [Mycena epipterygia]